ncbi:MAG: cation:proton antiporter [Rhizorhabdus sp.]|uniref:cation:proton antiporter domain-containing protein n=1 Tax=Rhizorhabdus sp. TaxID=1968843 RepID=UPI001B632736|nr:cation:proton antiporter [Rhizorhabdus sp.]MBP8233553.1 cation:proton antiporter [Rhizorhabdus sp.]
MALPIHSEAFSDSLVILGTAGIVIPLFARFRITPVIGFILVGMLAGPHGLGTLTERYPWLYYVTISNPRSIEPFAEFGIVLLLFSIGLELSFRRLWGLRRTVFGLGTSKLVLAAAILGMSLWVSGQSAAGSLGLGLALALSSTALVLPMVGTTGAIGQRAFGILLLEDLALVPIVFALGVMAPYGDADGWNGLIKTVMLGIAVVAAMLIGGRLLLPRLFAQAARAKNPELFLSASLLVVILSSIATTAVGLSPIVGALIAGLLIAETDYHAEVELVTAPFKGLALGVFLITVGMSLDPVMILENWDKLAFAVIAVVLVKALITAGLLRFWGAKRAVAAETGLLMSSPSETTLIVLATAAQARLIAADTAAFWQMVTAIGLTITPILARVGHDLARRVDERDQDAEDSSEEHSGRAIIAGFGRVGRLVAQMLSTHSKPYMAIDADIDTVHHARKRGYSVMFGDIARPGMVEHLDLSNATALILTMDDPVQVVRITRHVRRLHPELTIVARARDPNHAAELYRAGATDAVPETLESSLQLSEAVLVDLGIAMGPVIASIHEKRAELRAKIMEMGQLSHEPRISTRRLRDVKTDEI